MIEKAGAGPTPIPPKALTVESLTGAILFVIGRSAQLAAQELANRIHSEVSTLLPFLASCYNVFIRTV